jgi:23S rRNA (adenine2030-N6)-methyltransferase
MLLDVLQYMVTKDKPFFYLDTHAGAGEYRFDTEVALKNREFQGGILGLYEADGLQPELETYLALIRAMNPGSQLLSYPGSPRIARSVLRCMDRMTLCELHNNEVENLRLFAAGDRRIQVRHEDGLRALLASLPPLERRAVVMIDPSYEIKTDYLQVADSVYKAWRKFSQGVYLIWYPLLEDRPGERMCDAIARSGIVDIQQFELQVSESGGRGMAGSGMLVINPPWVLLEQMQRCLPQLMERLGTDSGAGWRAEIRVSE